MQVITGWLMALMMLEFAVGAFLLFAARGMPWYKRAFGALFSLGCFVIFVALLYQLLAGHHDDVPRVESGLLIFLFLFVNFFGFRLIRHLFKREEGFGCLGTLGRLAGCVVIAWGLFALLVFGIALTIGLVGYFS